MVNKSNFNIKVNGDSLEIRCNKNCPIMRQCRSTSAMINRVYDGVNLTRVHAREISRTRGANKTERQWNWIHERIRSSDWEGINVGDWMPLEVESNSLKMVVAGINTYYNYGSQQSPPGRTPSHIDFISQDCYPGPRRWNPVDNNNGISEQHSPWLASEIKKWLNSEEGNVPNSSTDNATTAHVDYTTQGLFDKLPAILKTLIVPKGLYIPLRYKAGELLLEDNDGAWQDIGRLWLPFEYEVYGSVIWGSKTVRGIPYNSYGMKQYPLFANNMKQIKMQDSGHAIQQHWLLASVSGYSSTQVCGVGSNGNASTSEASYPTHQVPVCFRIS